MSDKYDDNQYDQTDDQLAQDDEYLEDDYADDPADDDGDWSEDDSQSNEEPPKKKSSMGNILIIGVAVVAGLLFMVYKFGGSKNAELPAVDPKAPQVAEFSDAPAAPSDAATDSPAPAPDALPAPDQMAQQPLTPMPADAPSDSAAPQPQGGLMTGADPALTMAPATPAPSDLTAPQPVPGDAVSQPIPAPVQPVSDFPSVDLIKKVPPAPAADGLLQPAPSAAPVSTDVAAAPQPVDAKAPAASDLLPVGSAPNPAPVPASVPALSPTPVAETAPSLTPAPTPAVAADPALQAKLDDANSKISSYEGEVSTLKDRVAELESQLARANDRAASSASSPKPITDSGEPTVAKKTVTRKVVHTNDSVPKTVRSNEAPVQWVLKGAQSGKALLSKAGQSDVTTVRVGDYIPGLGRILSITQGSSGWVVVGTASRVQE